MIRVEGGEISRIGGIVRVEPRADADLVSIRSQSFGMGADRGSFLLGYGNSQTIAVPSSSSCRALIIIENNADEAKLVEWKKFFEQYPNVCITGSD